MNALAELLKQLMATSIPVMPSMPFTGTPPNMQSDIISRLSAELRHIVYSDLNIPVGGHVWIDCPSDSTCTDTSHIIFYANAKWPTRVHAPFGECQVRRKINNLLSYRGFRKILAELVNGDIIGCNSRVFIERNLLCINKAIRTELMDLVFGRNGVEVSPPMHDEPNRILELYRASHIRTINHVHRLPSALTHMMMVTIRSSEREMKNGCQSLQFIAVNFANLRRLTYHIQSTSLYLTPTEEVIALVEAFRAIAVTAKKLQMLHFAWNEEDLTTGQCQSSE